MDYAYVIIETGTQDSFVTQDHHPASGFLFMEHLKHFPANLYICVTLLATDVFLDLESSLAVSV